MSPPDAPLPLLEALRAQLGAEAGRPPSRRLLERRIAAGAARVDGRVVRDPATPVEPGARLAFDADDLSPEALRGPPPARTRAAPPPGVLHADAQVVVVERAAFEAPTPEALAAAVGALLGRSGLCAAPDPSAPGHGPVLLLASAALARAHAQALADGRVRETLLALRTPGLALRTPGSAAGALPGALPAGAHEAVLERGTHAGTPWALVQRDDAPLAPAPAGERHLVAPQRLALAFKHPRTHKRLALEVGAHARFLAACAAHGVTGGSGG
ncbi:MAG: S4 domain-containing protein [Planctomycetia bacterium]